MRRSWPCATCLNNELLLYSNESLFQTHDAGHNHVVHTTVYWEGGREGEREGGREGGTEKGRERERESGRESEGETHLLLTDCSHG